jgi:hypothetical protein
MSTLVGLVDDDIYTIKTGANSPSLVVELFDNYGKPDQSRVTGLDTALSITFIFKNGSKAEGQPPDLRGTGQYWVNPSGPVYTGAVEYEWGITDVATIASPGVGPVNFEVDVEWSAGKIETFPSRGYFQLVVENDLD